jgi:sugar-specific transcriptional regulator TrmB
MTPLEMLRTYMGRLGMDTQAADIYEALRLHGPQTISALARTSGVERIRIYRLLDDLKAAGIVEVEVQYKRSILHAAPIGQLEVLLAKRQQELVDLREGYAELTKLFADHSISSAQTRVRFYEGMDGIKQVLWNQTKAKGEGLAILRDNMQHKTNLAFFERWVRRCNERQLKHRGIIGKDFAATQQDWYARHSNERLEHWQARAVPDEVFPLPYSLVTYDDVVVHYNWNDGRMFAIEIHDAAVAMMQRQFFELLWKQAVPVDDMHGSV